MNRSLFLDLESRLMLSTAKLNLTVDASKLLNVRSAIEAAIEQLKEHVADSKETIADAKAELKKDRDALTAKTKTLRAELKESEKAMKAELDEAKTQTKALEQKWAAKIKAAKLDVSVVGENESADEQAKDKAQLALHVAAYNKARAGIDLDLKLDTKVIEADRKLDLEKLKAIEEKANSEIKLDEKAVAAAEKGAQRVFQAEQKIVEAQMKLYEKLGGKLKDVKLPKLSDLLK